MPKLVVKRNITGSYRSIESTHIYSYNGRLYLRTDEGSVRLDGELSAGIYLCDPSHEEGCEDLGPLEVVFE